MAQKIKNVTNAPWSQNTTENRYVLWWTRSTVNRMWLME